jgi:hypothetical protein
MAWVRRSLGDITGLRIFVLRYGALLFALAVAAILLQLFGRDWWRWWKSRQHVLKVQRGEVEASDATMLYHRMLKVLHRRGIEKPAWGDAL